MKYMRSKNFNIIYGWEKVLFPIDKTDKQMEADNLGAQKILNNKIQAQRKISLWFNDVSVSNCPTTAKYQNL